MGLPSLDRERLTSIWWELTEPIVSRSQPRRRRSAIMLVMRGALGIIWGIAAVSSSHFFVAGASYILSDLNTWGGIVMGFGAVEVLAALSVWRGGEFGRWFGIFAALLAGLAAMFSIPAYPFWSLTLVAIEVLVIYGLAAYGGKPYLPR
ncbi:MAG TPA: hypothetical protein VMJ65_28270 [Solirubrobacteraceae bacterium]|nr:hypothetical protein [Solirubrobacteraceae bacterium]